MNDSPWRPMGDCKLQGSSLCRRQGRVNHKEQSLNHERAYRPAHSLARERGHLGRVSRPSDRLGGRFGSCIFRLFCRKVHEKILNFSQNQPAVQQLRFPAVLQKSPRTLKKLTRGPASFLRKSYEKALNHSRKQPAVQQSG